MPAHLHNTSQSEAAPACGSRGCSPLPLPLLRPALRPLRRPRRALARAHGGEAVRLPSVRRQLPPQQRAVRARESAPRWAIAAATARHGEAFSRLQGGERLNSYSCPAPRSFAEGQRAPEGRASAGHCCAQPEAPPGGPLGGGARPADGDGASFSAAEEEKEAEETAALAMLPLGQPPAQAALCSGASPDQTCPCCGPYCACTSSVGDGDCCATSSLLFGLKA